MYIYIYIYIYIYTGTGILGFGVPWGLDSDVLGGRWGPGSVPLGLSGPGTDRGAKIIGAGDEVTDKWPM